ncbi:chemotaxis protein CheD [Bacillus bombysepticus]|uniref:chemotaxis protein CheD n=1 Tax=Bacillus bombysepticus TaxID=658666 RepID=UPI003017C967
MTLPIHNIKIADIGFSKNPAILKTNSLGSCVGILLYDSSKHFGGIIHALLPTSFESKTEQYGKYVNTSIEHLVNSFHSSGSKVSDIYAMIFGGSHMIFQTTCSNLSTIGERNILETIFQLNKLNIPIVAQDTGGIVPRTVVFNTNTGVVTLYLMKENVKSFNFNQKKLTLI